MPFQWVVFILIIYLQLKIQFKNSLKRGETADSLLAVDWIDFCIPEPNPVCKSNFSKRISGAAVWYEIGISTYTGDICWVNGPFAPGTHSPLKIFEIGLKNQIETDACVFNLDVTGDMKEDEVEELYLRKKSTEKIQVQQNAVIAMLNDFKVISSYRHPYKKHEKLMTAVTVIVQVRIAKEKKASLENVHSIKNLQKVFQRLSM